MNTKFSLHDTFQPFCNLCGQKPTKLAKCESLSPDSELTSIFYICKECSDRISYTLNDKTQELKCQNWNEL